MPQEEFDIQQFAASFHAIEEVEGIELQLSLGLELESFFNKTTKLPSPSDSKILAAYTMLPSMLCKIIPVLALKGCAGSGKSQILTGISKLLNVTMVAGNSTAASIKNTINRLRWKDPSTLQYEKNCHLLLDNVNSETFDSNETLGCFLNGYNRETDRQYISIGKGENIEFRTFCPKVFTSVWDIESPELLRRLLVIRTSKSIDLEGVGDDIPELSSLQKEVKKYWDNINNCQSFALIRRAMRFKANLPLSKEQFILVADLMATGITVGVWEDLPTASQQFAELFAKNKGKKTLLEMVVIEALEGCLGAKSSEWLELSGHMKLQILPKNLKMAIEPAILDGVIPRPPLARIQEILAQQGFVVGNSPSTGIVYRYLSPSKAPSSNASERDK